jgi:hypothetical protein
MNFQDWLDVKFTPEEELSIEKEAFDLKKQEDPEHVLHTCVALLKQSRYQSKLLERAVNRIGFLEMEIDTLTNLGQRKP